ncbi:hypothetical protein [Gracilimonas sp.]|uniref:hypothetical protein n=1 Tax=Gracilimonas sp. TaxID=1974203 RepID=UPI002870DC31|nr:hypothetical protein [Gracilimonas sp.]
MDIDSINVKVTGNTYFLEKLERGEQRTIRIDPKADSHISITTENEKHVLTIDTYLDQGSTGGSIKAEITTDSVISFIHRRGLL